MVSTLEVSLKIEENFSSERLSASRIQYDDWPDLLQAVTSELFPRDLGLSRIKTELDAQNWHRGRVIDWNESKCFVWSIRWNGESEVIGQLSLLPRKNDIALAYWVNPKCWGEGVTTEMCSALIEVLANSGFDGTIWAGTHTWNGRSSSVLNRLGFKFKGEVEHAYEGRIDTICEYTFAVENR